MTIGAQQAEQWRDEDAGNEAHQAREPETAEALGEFAPADETFDPPPMPIFWRETVPAAVLALLSIGWVMASGWIIATSSPARTDAAELIGWIGLASGPLALMAILYLLLQRTSRREARRFARSARAMGAQAAYLERVLASLSGRAEEHRALLAQHAGLLVEQRDQAAARLGEISGAIGEETNRIDHSSALLAGAASAARDDMAKLMDSLPRAEAQTREMTELLQEASRSVQQQTVELAGQLAALATHGREADQVAGAATRSLTDHLARVAESGAVADQRMRDAGAEMAALVDRALAQATEAVEQTRRAMETQSAAMLAMIEQGRAALDRAGSDSARSLGQRLEEIGDKVDSLASRLAAQDAASHALIGNLDKALGEIEQRFTTLGDTGTERTADLAEALVTLSIHVEQMRTSLAHGGDAADAMLQRAMLLKSTLEQAQEAIAAAVPDAARLEGKTRAASEILGTTDGAIARQREAVEELGRAAETHVMRIRDQAETLHALIADTEQSSAELVRGSGPQLVEALLRVREAAVQAADHAREALGRVIPEAAETLGTASAEAMDRALVGRVERQMADVVAAAEQAVRTASDASQRLTQQLLTISDTTATVEARIEKAKADADAEATFSHRVALLIESLNSTAIDVTKILSNEVTDSAWAAYLRGDRGIFTRRAVRLISSGEAREIARHYEEEPEFREHVNRYIHDFEAMLRRILASRDSSPLSVTMLSSDMGKLYVALAQAIERLRK